MYQVINDKNLIITERPQLLQLVMDKCFKCVNDGRNLMTQRG